MNLLKAISSLKTDGFLRPKVVEPKNTVPDWTLDPYRNRVIPINNKLLIELEDGSEHEIEKGNYYEIPEKTFYKITSRETGTRFMISSKAA